MQEKDIYILPKVQGLVKWCYLRWVHKNKTEFEVFTSCKFINFKDNYEDDDNTSVNSPVKRHYIY